MSKEETNVEKNKEAEEAASWESSRVFRGGSWNVSPPYLRSARRYNAAPSGRGNSLGFRLVLQTKEKK